MKDTPQIDALMTKKEELGTESVGAFLEWFLHERQGQLCEFREKRPGVPCPHRGKSRRDLISTGLVPSTTASKVTCPGCNAELSNGYRIHEWLEDPEPEGYYPLSTSIDQLLAEYAGIDEQAVERERRALLEGLRKSA